MKILGIDPGLQCTGFGVIETSGQQVSYVASGTIKTTHLSTTHLPLRIKTIFDGVREVAEQFKVDQAAIEIVFINNNPQSSLLLGQVRGACLSALVSLSLPVAEYTALQMKKSVAGHGRAQKAQIQEMVKRILSLSKAPGTDASDALGLALTHAQVAWSERHAQLKPNLVSRHTGAVKAGRSR